MSRIFWDTNLFIYLIKDVGDLSERVVRLRRRMLRRGDQLLTSTLTLGEVLVKPREAGESSLCQVYRDTLHASAVLVPFDAAAAEIFATIRADRSIRPPDAIQLACAGRAIVDLFITNDDRLSEMDVPGVQFVSSLQRALV